MAVVRQGINTGLLGYTLKKEFLGESLCFRETQTFTYEMYSTDFVSGSADIIHDIIYNDFVNRFSGNIYVQVVDIPADYAFPNDHIHAARYRVSVDVKSSPLVLFTGQGLTGTYYTGLSSSFWTTYGPVLIDFKEEFTFEEPENGNKGFNHELSFGLITGTKALAIQIASGIFATDEGTNFGITAFPSGALVADEDLYENFYTEVYDQIRQSYRFAKRRELSAFTGTLASYTLNHTLDFREDGIFDISENAQLEGNFSFAQAKTHLDVLITGAYNRCNNFYVDFGGLAGTNSTTTLSTFPTKTTKGYNRNGMMAEYSISFTTNPNFQNDGTSIDETFDLSANELNYVDLKHHFNFTDNLRTATTTFMNLIANASGVSPSRAANFYSQQGSLYTPSLPLQGIKYEMTWPNRDTKASVEFQYTNNPKYFKTLNGVQFKYVDTKVQDVKPVDIVNEYKIINRPTKFSVLNYAYQTQKGQLLVTVEGGLGRNPSEFTNFRNGYGDALVALYKYGISIFMNEFLNVIPTAFTYFLSDLKYTLNQDGVLVLSLVFDYTLKKYTL